MAAILSKRSPARRRARARATGHQLRVAHEQAQVDVDRRGFARLEGELPEAHRPQVEQAQRMLLHERVRGRSGSPAGVHRDGRADWIRSRSSPPAARDRRRQPPRARRSRRHAVAAR